MNTNKRKNQNNRQTNYKALVEGCTEADEIISKENNNNDIFFEVVSPACWGRMLP